MSRTKKLTWPLHFAITKEGFTASCQVPDATYSSSSPGWLLRQPLLKHVISRTVLLQVHMRKRSSMNSLYGSIYWRNLTSLTIGVSNHIMKIMAWTTENDVPNDSLWLSSLSWQLDGKWCTPDPHTCQNFRHKALRVWLKLVWCKYGCKTWLQGM